VGQKASNPTLEPQDLLSGATGLATSGFNYVKGLFGYGGAPSAAVPGVGQGSSTINTAAIAASGSITISNAMVIGGGGTSGLGGSFGDLSSLLGSSGDLSSAFDSLASTGDFTDLLSSAPEAFAGFAEGGVFTPFARGGIVNRPTVFPFAGGIGLMGEAGPEAIMPLARHSDGSLGVRAQSGGSDSPSVVIHNYSGKEAKATETRDSRGGRSIVVQVGEAAAEDIKTGGPMSQQLQRSFGTSRVPIQR
jgi:phage-related minor tail protein